MSPGILDEKMYVYAASQLTPGEMALEAGEDIRVLKLTWDEALERVHDGRIRDAKSVAALLYYDAFRRGREQGAGAGSKTQSKLPAPCSPLQIPKPAAWSLEFVPLKLPAVLCPTVTTAPKTAMRMSASITAYSTEVAAVVSQKNRRRRDMGGFTVNVLIAFGAMLPPASRGTA